MRQTYIEPRVVVHCLQMDHEAAALQYLAGTSLLRCHFWTAPFSVLHCGPGRHLNVVNPPSPVALWQPWVNPCESHIPKSEQLRPMALERLWNAWAWRRLQELPMVKPWGWDRWHPAVSSIGKESCWVIIGHGRRCVKHQEANPKKRFC